MFAPDLATSNDGYPDDVEMASITEDNFWRRARNRLFTWVVRHKCPGTRSLLEVGCGTGGVIRAMRAAFPSLTITGAEIYVEPLLRLSQHLDDVAVLQMDATRIPFRDEFDLVAAFDVIEHIEDDAAVLSEMVASVRPGGRVLISVPQHPSLWSQRDVRLHHKRRYTRASLLERMRDAGLEIEYVTSFMTFPLPVMALQALRNRRPKADYDAHAELKTGRMVSAPLDAVLALERLVIRAGVSFPAGGSLLALGRRAGT